MSAAAPSSSSADAPIRASAVLAGTAAVAATYVYFLIFAQFGFLKVLTEVLGAGSGWLKPILATMALAGAAAGAGVARAFRPAQGRDWLLAGFAVAGAAAGVVATASSVAALLGGALLTGAGLGTVTVALAASLRGVVGHRALAWSIGLGTGLAYAICNVPPIFAAGGRAQAWLGLLAAAGGALAVGPFRVAPVPVEADRFDGRPRGVGGWVAVFLTLVWLDSAAFFIIQHAPALRAATWQGEARLWTNAGVHLVAALGAAALLARGRLATTVALAGGGLVAAGFLLEVAPGTAAVAYAAGVSLYSAALVFYPARLARPGVAAWVYGVAGWVGSALGIGMAENLGRVPGGFLVVAAGALTVLLAGRARAVRGAAALAVVGLALAAGTNRVEAATLVETGRQVYVAEGCIHCHSQYVRPGTLDEELYGPAHPLAEALAARPPLLGNRRQGPDLTNVGLRRTAEWQRAHLQRPRLYSPGSRMPSYRHLFAAGDPRGEALVAYLMSLGRVTIVQ